MMARMFGDYEPPRLLDYLLPIFHEQSGYIVKTIAVGTGKAMKMAEDGNADVLLVHAPSAEKELI